MPNTTFILSTEIVTAKTPSELVDLIRKIVKNSNEGRIITMTCAVTTMREESLEDLPDR